MYRGLFYLCGHSTCITRWYHPIICHLNSCDGVILCWQVCHGYMGQMHKRHTYFRKDDMNQPKQKLSLEKGGHGGHVRRTWRGTLFHRWMPVSLDHPNCGRIPMIHFGQSSSIVNVFFVNLVIGRTHVDIMCWLHFISLSVQLFSIGIL